MAQQLLTDLEAMTSLREAKQLFADLSLQFPNSAIMWLANPLPAFPKFDEDIGILPARLGLRPKRERYVLIWVRVINCLIPRFADSGGDEYWSPGGTTAPIDDCPKHCSGFDESVAQPLSLSAIYMPVIRFNRTV